MPVAVVTGAAGFLGSHLAGRLLAEGCTVVGVDNFITGRRENLAAFAADARFRLLEADVSAGLDVPETVDYVFHFASPASPPDYLRHPLETLAVGSRGTENALRLALRDKARFLLASTSEVYGDPLVHPQREDYWGNVNPIGPRSVYDEAKRFAEAITMAYRRSRGVNTAIVRIFNTYGPRMRLEDGRALPAFFGQALRGEDVTVFGDGRQTRSFTYVDDLVEGIWRLARADAPGPVNLGNPEEADLLTVAQEVIRLVGSQSRIVHRPLPADDPKVRRPDITLARDLLGWEPRVSRAEGFRRTLPYFHEAVAAQSSGAS